MNRRICQQVIRTFVVAFTAWFIAAGTAQTTEDLTNPAPGDWPTYGRTLDMWRYSPLDQINRDNVNQLQLVWSRDLATLGKNWSPVLLKPQMDRRLRMHSV